MKEIFKVTNKNGQLIGEISNVPIDFDEEMQINTLDSDVAIKLEALIELIQNNEIPHYIDFDLLPD